MVHPTDPPWCAIEARRFALAAGLSPVEAAAVAIVASELATNMVRHAGGGQLSLTRRADPPTLEVRAEDRGPGIADPQAALRDGVSRGRDQSDFACFDPRERQSLGCGLGAVARLMDSLEIENRVGGGAAVVACKRLEGAARR